MFGKAFPYTTDKRLFVYKLIGDEDTFEVNQINLTIFLMERLSACTISYSAIFVLSYHGNLSRKPLKG